MQDTNKLTLVAKCHEYKITFVLYVSWFEGELMEYKMLMELKLSL